MAKVKYGIIGLGWFGEYHGEALAGLPNVELYALCTRTESRLKELGKKFGVTKLYTDYHAMLADPELEAVSITTMWDQHTAPTLAALRAGKHVFLEKPMASTVADCRAIVQAAKASDKFLMVGHIVRFNPRYAAVKREIAAGKIGKIVSLYARRNVPVSIGAQVLPKIGPIIGDGVHDTDIMLWYTGAKIVSVYAQTLNVHGHKYPDIGWTMYRFDSGAIGVLENVWCMPDHKGYFPDERMEIIGTAGGVYLQETYPPLSVVTKDGAYTPDPTYWPEIRPGVRGGALAEELNYFITCILEKTPPTIITPEESMAAVQACLAAEASAATGKVVSVQDFE
ncbi:MAG: Gfo/Idh/MocA family oxidoreductase [Anaerolineae bacterium]|nr:Gfo/Idh/MocA family oxidoreductase [Anaerolineae bacterium]MDW8069901.1 Gfo/Idh/MocA family oxidoreductase [Anaerolineae bacterium]